MPSTIDGPVLKTQRQRELDLSPSEVAGLLEISVGYLRNIEAGRDQPSQRLIGRIARIYRIPIEAFVRDEGKDEGDDKEKTADPSHPTRRQDTEKTTGPKRVSDKAEVAA